MMAPIEEEQMNPITVTVQADMAETEARVREALAQNGFGVLTEIDVAAVLKAKIDVDRPALKILGACNPHLAHRALELDPSVALLLPCNVTLAAVDGGTRVDAVDPSELMDDPGFAAVAADARTKLQAALDGVAAG
jgi:uncharacterized protein (DUF302 family)